MTGPFCWSSTDLAPSSGARGKSLSRGKTRSLPDSTLKATRLSAETIVVCRLCHTRVICSLKGLPGDFAFSVRRRDCYRRSSAGSTGPFDHGHDTCGAQAAGNWVEDSVYLHMLHRSPGGVRHQWPYPPVVDAHSHRRTTADDSIRPTIPRWNGSLYAI